MGGRNVKFPGLTESCRRLGRWAREGLESRAARERFYDFTHVLGRSWRPIKIGFGLSNYLGLNRRIDSNRGERTSPLLGSSERYESAPWSDKQCRSDYIMQLQLEFGSMRGARGGHGEPFLISLRTQDLLGSTQRDGRCVARCRSSNRARAP